MAKLTDETVCAMREAHAGGASIRSLGRRYGVSKTVAGRIVKRLLWKHVA